MPTVVKTKYFFILSAFVIFYATSNFYWLSMNKAPYPWDQSYYLETSELMFKPLKSGDLKGFWIAYQNSMGGVKAPLISILYLPSYLSVGHGKSGVVLTIIAFEILLCYGVYFLALGIRKSELVALLSVIIFSLMPLTVGMSREVFVEYPLTLFAVLWVYLMLKSNNFKAYQYNLLMGILLGFGLILKITFPLFIIGPSIVSLYVRFRELRKKNIIDSQIGVLIINLVSILIPAIMIASSWYIKNAGSIMSFALSASFGDLAKDYSVGNSFWESIISFWKVLINDAFSAYLIVLVLALGLVYLTLKSRGLIRAMLGAETRSILWAWFLIPLVIFSLGTNKTDRFILPVLPSISILIGNMLWDVVSLYKVKYMFLIMFSLIPLYMFINLTYLLPWGTTFKIGDWIFLSPQMGYTRRPNSQVWPIVPIINTIIKDAKDRYLENSSQPIYIMLVPNHVYFNNHNFSYYARLLGIGPEKILIAAVNARSREDWLNSRMEGLLSGKYVITKTGDQGVPWVTSFNDEIMQMLDRHELPYEKVYHVALPDGSICSVYRKIEGQAITP